MCNFDAGGNRGTGTIKSGIGSLWGDQHYGPEYNCGAGTAIYAPFHRDEGSKSEKLQFFGFFLLFFLLQHDTLNRWSVGRDGFNVTYKKTAGGVILLLCLCIFAFFVLALCCTHFNVRTLLHEHS